MISNTVTVQFTQLNRDPDTFLFTQAFFYVIFEPTGVFTQNGVPAGYGGLRFPKYGPRLKPYGSLESETKAFSGAESQSDSQGPNSAPVSLNTFSAASSSSSVDQGKYI